jgi:hypothetical protein
MLGGYLEVAALIAWLALLARAGGRTAIRSTLQRVLVKAPRPVRWLGDRVEVFGAIGLVAVWLWISLSDVRPSVVDATVYWRLDLDHLYDDSLVNRVGAYLYSPVFAQIGEPFTFLRWTVWYASWTGLSVVLLAWMLRPAAALLTLAFPLVGNALWSGNIHFLTAAAAVLAVSLPAAWAFPLLTKVTPGVAILWHVARREWRSLAIALGATALVSAVSYVLVPQLWSEWFAVLSNSSDAPPVNTLLPLPLGVRVALAAVIVLIGGIRGWAWTIPVAMVVAQPVFWTAGLAVLVAIVPLSRPLAARVGPSDGARAASSSAARPG